MVNDNNSPLKGKIAVVTGASRGIGQAIALELGRQGADVVVNYKNSEADAFTIAKTLQDSGVRSLAYQADVSIFTQAQKLIKFSIEELGGLDILVNNAGITRDNLIMLMSEEDWDTVQLTNLKSAFNCSKAAVRYMIRKKYGRIVNITSVSGQLGNAGQVNYSASKAGQIGFTKALAREVAPRNITVNAIAAGYIDTEIWKNISEEMKQSVIRIIPLGRKGTPEEIAFAVAFLVSDKAAYITGQILGVDGGMAMQ